MAAISHESLVRALLHRYGRTYSAELGIPVGDNTPAALFQLLSAALLFSARISTDIFFREVQVAWDELFPFADRRALEGAGKLGLPEDPEALADLA